MRTATILQQPLWPIARHRKRWATGIVIAVLLVYLAALSPHWWVGKDSGLYLNLARNLARGEGYTLAGSPHTCVPPGFSIMLAGLMRIGASSFLALNIAMCLIGLAVVTVSYLLLRELLHPHWALLLTGLLALSREMLQRSGEILSDVPFTLLVVTALWLYARGLRKDKPDRRGWELGSLLLLASCVVRLAGLPLAVGAAAGLALSAGREGRRRALLNMALVFLGLAGTFGALWIYHRAHADPHMGSYIGALGRYNVSQYAAMAWLTRVAGAFGRTSGQLSRLFIAQRMPLIACLLLLVVPVAAAMIRRLRAGERLGPLVVLVYVGGLLPAAMLRTRYLLPLMPLLLLFLFEGYAWLAGLIARKRPVVAVRVVVALMVVVLGFNLPLIGRNIYLKHRHDYLLVQQHGKWRDLWATVDFLRERRGPSGAIIGSQPVGYLADMPCPLLSSRLRSSSPSDEEFVQLFQDWKVRYFELNLRDESNPFLRAAREYVERSSWPAFVYGDIRLYAIDETGLPTTAPATRPD